MRSKMSQIAEAFASDMDLGWRYCDHVVRVGDSIPASRSWVGDDPTDEILAGTCCWESEAMCRDYAKYSSGQIALVGGTRVGSGEEPGEILIDEAIVLAVEDI